MEVKQSTVDSKIAESRRKFDDLEKRRQEESQKMSVAQQNINAIIEEMVRLQGENRALESLKDNGQPKKPELVIPKKKETTKKEEK